MTDLPRRCDVTITADRDGGHHPHPAEFAVAAEQAASARAASIVSAHTARSSAWLPSWQYISLRPSPSPWPSSPTRQSFRLRHPSADWTAVPDLMGRFVEPGVALGFGAPHPAPQRQVARPAALAFGFASWLADSNDGKSSRHETMPLGAKELPDSADPPDRLFTARRWKDAWPRHSDHVADA
jgi:hypothetical protein